MQLQTIAALIIASAAHLVAAQDDSPDILVPYKSLVSDAAGDIHLSYNIYKKSAILLPPVDDLTSNSDELVVVNEQVLTDRIPGSAGAQDVVTLHLTTAGKVWHIDYTYKLESSARAIEPVTVLPATRGAVAVLKKPVARTVVEEQEKSFIQKYWMFIVPMLLVFMLGSGGGEGGGS
ncbi:hypothetical protein V1512DRAFT_267691 [Lipomyces arxii]|uniref:uncharacterized protein n=1 Tax=Lipomyces arxii TaxID=56418 RepID=UPI0034CFB3A1